MTAQPFRSVWLSAVVGGLAATVAFVFADAMGQLALQWNERFNSRETQAMATKAGVWIDHKQAIVVLITDAGQEIKKVTSGIEPPDRAAGSTRSKNKYTPNDFIAEDRRQQKLVDDRKRVFEEVLTCIRGADALLILGPGEAKGQFSKHIKTKKLRGLTVELETTDKMTDRQLATKVGKYFTSVTASKSAASQKKAMKKAVKEPSGKRPKKSGK